MLLLVDMFVFFLWGMSAWMKVSQACSNSTKLTLPSPFLSIYAIISLHFLSSASCYFLSSASVCKKVLFESEFEAFLIFLTPGSSTMVCLCCVGKAFLNSSSSMTPSLLASKSLNMYCKFFLVTTLLWSTAPAMNSWKSILPSPSRSTFSKIS